MTIDVIDLHDFYRGPLGQFAASVLRQDLSQIWPSVKDEDIAVLGYGVPFIEPYQRQAASLLSIMPESQGVAYWPEDGQNLSCLAHLDALPLGDESVNRVLMVHALETAQDPDVVLQEAWRVLKPQGQLLVMVPHRRGAWAHCDETPFGTGQPYSRTQLSNLLNEHGFSIEKTSRSLIAPPRQGKVSLVIAPYIESFGSFVLSRLGGILMIQATKQVYTPAYIKTRSVRRRLVLPMSAATSPLPTGRGHLAFCEKSCRLEQP